MIKHASIPLFYKLISIAALTSAHIDAAAQAQEEAESADWDVSSTVVLGAFSSGVDYSGEDRGRVTWNEGYAEVTLTGAWNIRNGMEMYTEVSGLASFTGGDGDAAGFTIGNEGRIALDDAVLGLRLGHDDPGRWHIDLSAGSQYVQIGDGFLVAGDALNLGSGLGENFDRGGAYWLGARRAFRESAVISATRDNLKIEAFYLGSTTAAQGDTKLAGVNAELEIAAIGTVGASYLRVIDTDITVSPSRDDLDTYNLRYTGSPFSEDLTLRGELALQRSREVDAYAAYAEAAYRFSDVGWAPELVYRYSIFSGDNPSTANTNEAFDPLFYGFTRGYGTWFQGEVAGNYAGPFNSNATIQSAQAYVHPTDDLRVGALYFRIDEREETLGIDADEINITVKWQATDSFFLSPVFGLYAPRGSQLSRSEDNHYFQIVAMLSF